MYTVGPLVVSLAVIVVGKTTAGRKVVSSWRNTLTTFFFYM